MITMDWVRRSVVVGGLLFGAGPAMAQEVADIHEQRREHGVICFTDHFHYGSSSGASSKRAAEIAAVQSWSDFVDFEYGPAWAGWGRSSSKSVKCSKAGPSGGWSCDISSRPCRR